MNCWLLLALLAALPGLPTAAQTPALPAADPVRLVATYQLTYRPDSTQPATRTEVMYLLLGSTQSLFESQGNWAGDSLLATTEGAPFTQENLDLFTTRLSALPHSRFSFSIYKMAAPRRIYYYDRLGRQRYYYEEVEALTWRTTPATATVAGYPCQRATASFGGRQ